MTDKPTIILELPPPLRGLDDDDDLREEAPDAEEDPVAALRWRLDIPEQISDVTIAASLAAIASRGDQRARWLAAFSSPLGKWLAMRGADLNTALNIVLSFAPRPAS